MSDYRADCFGCWVSSWPAGTKPVPEPAWLLGEGWTLNHREIGSARRPSWVLQTRRHIATLSKATPQELAEFGPALAGAMSAAGAACEAPRMFMQLTNQRGHFHLDLVPWYEGDTVSEAGLLVEHDMPAGVVRRDLAYLLEKTGQALPAGLLSAKVL